MSLRCRGVNWIVFITPSHHPHGFDLRGVPPPVSFGNCRKYWTGETITRSEVWTFVVPNVIDLEDFDRSRPWIGLDPGYHDAASLGDAGLRFAAEYSTRSVHSELPVGCLIVAMGQVGYYGKRPGQELSDQRVRI